MLLSPLPPRTKLLCAMTNKSVFHFRALEAVDNCFNLEIYDTLSLIVTVCKLIIKCSFVHINLTVPTINLIHEKLEWPQYSLLSTYNE